jgi:hypothetical protein
LTEVNWKSAAKKIGDLFKERCFLIRSDIDADEILKASRETLSAPAQYCGADQSSSFSLNASILKETLDGINARHREKILVTAKGFGEVVRQYDQGVEQISSELVEEEKDHILVGANGILMRIEKEMALKILTLGSLP